MEQKLEEYLDFLKTQKPLEVVAGGGDEDYHILFGRKKEKGSVGGVMLKRIYEGVCKNIEDEIIGRYFDGSDVVEDVQGIMTDTMDRMDKMDLDKEEGDEEEIARWSCSLITPESGDLDIVGLFALRDSQFEKVFTVSTVDFQILEQLVGYACNNRKEISGAKMDTLAGVGLGRKMVDGSPLRSVFPIYQKILSVDPSIVTRKILLPMYQRKVGIPRPLLNGIDKEEFLSLALAWMKEESIDLGPSFINTLTILFEGKKKLEDCNYEVLIKLLEQSFRVRPDDKTIAFFLRSFLSAFGSAMKEEQLRMLHDLNEFNQTDLKQSVQSLIEKNLSCNS